jgi:hypothetical protein
MSKKIVTRIIIGAIVLFGIPTFIGSNYAPLLVGNVDLYYQLEGIDKAFDKCEAQGLKGEELSACGELWAPLITADLRK